MKKLVYIEPVESKEVEGNGVHTSCLEESCGFDKFLLLFSLLLLVVLCSLSIKLWHSFLQWNMSYPDININSLHTDNHGTQIFRCFV